MKCKKLILTIIFILTSIITIANPNWYQEANSDYNSIGSNAFIGFASNYALNSTNQTFNQCSFSGSIYTPVSADIDLDGIPEIITTPTTTTISILSHQCEEKYLINTAPQTIVAMPVIINFNGNTIPEIVLLHNQTIEFFEKTNDTINLILRNNFSTIINGVNGLTCFNIPTENCLIFRSGNKTVYKYVPDTDTFSTVGNTLSQNFVTTAYSGVSNSRVASNIYYAIVGQEFTSGTIIYNILNQDGINQLSITGLNMGTAITSIVSQDIFIAKVGGVFRILETSKPNASSIHYYWSMRSLTGAVISSFPSNGGTDSGLSNIMVGDYNKDGSNEACVITKNGALASDSSQFLCINSIGNTITNLTLSINLSISKFDGSVMGDFLPNHNTLGIATLQGIYYQNSSGDLNLEYNTGFAYATNRNGRLITIFGNLNHDNSIIYSDTNFGFILSKQGSITCGDGICEGLENDLVCPQDCSFGQDAQLNATGDPCTKNSECVSNYCGYGTCSLGSLNSDCVINSQCLSSQCHLGKCTKADLWTSIDSSKSEQFGSTTNTNNLIALIVMIIAMIGTIVATHGHPMGIVAGIGVFYASAVFFTIVGWLSPFILFGMIIFAVIIGVIIFMIGSGSGG